MLQVQLQNQTKKTLNYLMWPFQIWSCFRFENLGENLMKDEGTLTFELKTAHLSKKKQRALFTILSF